MHDLVPGTPINDFCSGAFGRDFHGRARVEAVGHDWVVVRDEWGEVYCASGPNTIQRVVEGARRSAGLEAEER